MTSTVASAVSDWKQPELYALNSTASLPTDFVERLRKDSLADDEILYINLRWQFLRRHPHYQMWWSRLDGSAFGLQCEKCPSPSEMHPAGITFCENAKGEVDRYFKHLMELAKQDPAGLPPLDRFRQSLIRAT